jgi:hypothetical protein
MLDGKAYKALLSDDTDPDLVPRLRDPKLLNAFAALADDLRTVIGQIALDRDVDQMDDIVRYGRVLKPRFSREQGCEQQSIEGIRPKLLPLLLSP